ncbi:MAG: hypothetical protein ACR2L8_00090 [Solirubrobacteraceae bacterium]
MRPRRPLRASHRGWWATFDRAEEERDRWVEHFERDGFATWLGSLRGQLEP